MAAPNLNSPTSITGKAVFTALATTTETTLVTNSASSGKAFRVTLLAIANVDGAAAADATVSVYNAASGGTAFKLIHTVSVPADSTFAPIGRDASLWLEEDRRITVQASAANDLHVILSYEEVS